VAAAHGYADLTRFLLSRSRNPNVQDNDGWTPLHAAACWCQVRNLQVHDAFFCAFDASRAAQEQACFLLRSILPEFSSFFFVGLSVKGDLMAVVAARRKLRNSVLTTDDVTQKATTPFTDCVICGIESTM